jgi:hypothetical protein
MNRLNKKYAIDNITVATTATPIGTIWQAGTRITVTSINKVYILVNSNNAGDTISTLLTNNKVVGITMDIPIIVGTPVGGDIKGEGGDIKEEGNEVFHKTTITLDGAFGAIAGGAALALGNLIYTFPAGVIRINTVALNNIKIQQTEDNVTADKPQLGVGTTIGTGVTAILATTTDNLLAGVAIEDCDGTAVLRATASNLTILATAAHTVHFNIADDWAASGDAALGFTGEVVITWELLS